MKPPFFRALFVLVLIIGLMPVPGWELGFAQDDSAAPAVEVNTGGESEDEGVSKGETTLIGLIKSGGWAMWILGAFSLGLVALCVYNFIDLKEKNFSPPELSVALEGDMDLADIEGAMERTQSSPTCLGQIIYGAMDYVVNRGYTVLDGEHLDNLMADASRAFNRKRARTINYFSVLGQAAPMVGLLGTVSGMIKAFANLGQSGMGDPSKLAANISEALVTTASGLVIAIPAIFGYFFFRDRLSNLVYLSDEKAAALMNRFRTAVYTEGEAQAGDEAGLLGEGEMPAPALASEGEVEEGGEEG
ncbi:MAG: MotA/TolQ/ExbB proton channel family protein [Verrucomicrobiota bacterium]